MCASAAALLGVRIASERPIAAVLPVISMGITLNWIVCLILWILYGTIKLVATHYAALTDHGDRHEEEWQQKYLVSPERFCPDSYYQYAYRETWAQIFPRILWKLQTYKNKSFISDTSETGLFQKCNVRECLYCLRQFRSVKLVSVIPPHSLFLWRLVVLPFPVRWSPGCPSDLQDQRLII